MTHWKSPPPVQLLVFAVCIAADQLTKYLAALRFASSAPSSFLAGTVRVEYVLNPYGFLSSLAPLPESVRSQLLTWGVLLLAAVGLVFVCTTRRLHVRQLWAAWIVLAGGISNLLDRFLHNGSVIDFLQLKLGFLQTGIFNAADMYILFGSFYLGYSLFTDNSPNGRAG